MAAKRQTRRPPLRAVGPDETPAAEPEKRLTVTEAAEAGSEKALYIAMRERIAKTVEDPKCPPRDLASLTRRLSELAKDIAAIEAVERKDGGGAAATPDEDFRTG